MNFFNNKKHLAYFALGLILVTTVMIYYPTRHYEFIDFDDHIYITNNEHIRDLSPHGIINILFGPTHVQGTRLTILSLAVDYAIGGLNPSVYRMHNIFLYLMGMVVLFFFIRKLFQRYDLAILVVGLFAVLSTHVESVVWVSQRKDMLYFLFYFLALLAYLKYLEKNHNVKWLLAAFLFFFLSFHAKVAAAPLVVVLFLIDYYKKRPFEWKMILEKVPFILFFLFYSIRYSGLDTTMTSVIYEDAEQVKNMTMVYYTFTDRLFMGAYALLYYIRMFFYPHPIYFIHPYPEKINDALPQEYYTSFATILMIAAAVTFLFFKLKTKNKRQLLFGLLFFLVNIGLYLHVLVDIKGIVIVADRYTYVAYVGLLIITASIIAQLFNSRQRFFKTWMLRLGLLLYAILFIQHAVVAIKYTKAWQNDKTLFTEIIEKNINIVYAYNNRGTYYYNNQEFEKALADFNKAIKINPNAVHLYNNRGATYVQLEMYEEALSDLKISIKYNPNDKATQFNLAKCLLFIEDQDESIKAYEKVIEKDPYNADAWNDRGKLKNEMGLYHDAIYSLNKAIELDATNHLAYNNRGISYASIYEYDKAMSDFHKAIKLDSLYSDPYMNIATILALNNYCGDAIYYYNKAIDLKHTNPYVYFNRGVCFFNLNQREAACKDWEKAHSLGVEEALIELQTNCN